MILKPIVHEIRIQNQVIFLDPPIEYARSTWIKQLHDWLGKYNGSKHCLAGSSIDCFIFIKVSFVGYTVFKVRDMKLGYRCKERLHRKRPTRHWYIFPMPFDPRLPFPNSKKIFSSS